MVGVLIGSVGVGGILLIPALNRLAPLPIQEAMATALLTFVFTGLMASVLFHRRGSIDWRVTRPLCAGGVLFGFAGAWANARLDPTLLTAILALLIAAAGLYTLLSSGSASRLPAVERPGTQPVLLFALGAVTGFGSGLTGVGGPAVSVPLMVLCGFAPLTAVGSSQVLQVIAALSGTAGNLLHVTIDWPLAGMLTGLEVLGVAGGVRLAHALKPHVLRVIVGLLCLAVGVALLVRLAT
ncbi:MAG: sulfite exporter TauE/SafE family protein [Caldimonas sp.]